MLNTIVPQQPRNLQAHSTEQFPEGLYIDHVTGEVFASQSSASRLIDKTEATVRNYVSTEFEQSQGLIFETAQTRSQQGGKQSKLLPEFVLLALIAKYKPDLLSACASAGLRVFLHRLAGFEVQSTAIAPPKSDRELMLEAKLELVETQKELVEVKLLMEQKSSYILKATAEAPGLKDMMDYAQDVEDSTLPVEERVNWTLHEWMSTNKKIQLEGIMWKKFVSKVHGAYKAVRHEAPMTDYRPQINNPKNHKRVQVYTDRDFGILQQCYYQTLVEA